MIKTISCLFLIVAFLSPLYQIFCAQATMGKSDYLHAGILLCIELLCVVAFYVMRSKWANWLIRRSKNFDFGPNTKPVEVATATYLNYIGIVFGIILPFGLYLNRPMEMDDISSAFIGTLFAWLFMFGSPLHYVLTGESSKAKTWRFPIVSLAGLLLAVASYPLPYSSTVVTLVLLCTFCAEVALILGIRTYRAQRHKEGE